jgi:hypothetical protein
VAVELMGSIPFLVIGLLAALQLVFAVATAQATSTAARAGARAISQGSPNAAGSARRAVPRWVERRMQVTVVGTASGIQVRTRIPVVLPGVAGPTVVRNAWFEPEQGVAPWG